MARFRIDYYGWEVVEGDVVRQVHSGSEDLETRAEPRDFLLAFFDTY